STVNIIGEKELRSMKKSAYLINLTGGQAIEERLLVRALKEKWIAGAVLDAFARQPLPEDSELWSLPMLSLARESASAPKKSGRRFGRFSWRTGSVSSQASRSLT